MKRILVCVLLLAFARGHVSATDAPGQDAWKKAMAALAHAPDHLQRTFNTRRAASTHERTNPPPMIKKVNFCNAPAMTTPTAAPAQP